MAVKVSIVVPVYNVEKYLREMLESVKDQTFSDFEVLLVNDGSTDGSQEIIDEYCGNDERFRSFYQENSGVSAARNKGLEFATGEYVAFYDSDDVIPEKALEDLYKAAKNESADVAIGIMKELSSMQMPVNEHTKNLSKMKEIDKFDINLIYSFSLANKLFKREVIEDLNLRFKKIRHTEDGIFVFSFIHSCRKITGCSSEVYYYRRRPSWEGASVTQTGSMELLQDFILALDTIAGIVHESAGLEMKTLEHKEGVTEAELNELKCKQLTYISTLYTRLISTSLINGFYRLLWRCDDKAVELINEKIQEYRHFVFPSMWNQIAELHDDIGFTKGLKSKEAVSQNPLVSFFVSDKVSKEWVNQVLQAIYMQTCPSFEVFIQEDLRDCIHEGFLANCNAHLIAGKDLKQFKKNALKKRKGEFLCFVDENILVDTNSILSMYRTMKDNIKIEFATAELCHIDEDGGSQQIPCHSVLFYKKFNKKLAQRCMFNRFDWTSSNKLFRASAIKSRKIVFSNTPGEDIERCYSVMHFSKMKNVYMFTPLTNADIKKKADHALAKLLYPFESKRFYKESKEGKKAKAEKRTELKKKCIDYARRLLPVRKKVFFISIRETGKLLENSKSLYDAVDAKKTFIAAQYPHSLKLQLKIMYHLFTSKVIVTDDYLKYLRLYKLKEKQKVLQIWHACGLFKKFGLDYLPWNIKEEKATHARYDCVTISGESLKEGYASAFGIGEDRIQALGVPRTDMFYDKSLIADRQKAFYQKNPELENKKLVLYAPTFREEGTKRIEYDPKIDWNSLNEKLQETDVVLLIKNHPVMKYNLLKGKKYSNIKNMNKVSTYDLMFVSDALITDYSSVIFEYALLDKPMIFYCPDYKEYERDFYLNFPEDAAGEFVTQGEELAAAIQKSLSNVDAERLKVFREKYMGACDGHSSQRIAAQIKTYLN